MSNNIALVLEATRDSLYATNLSSGNIPADPAIVTSFNSQLASNAVTPTNSQAVPLARIIIDAVRQPGGGYADRIASNLSPTERERLVVPLDLLRQAERTLDHSAVVEQLYNLATLSGLPGSGVVYDYFADNVLHNAGVIGPHLDQRDQNYYGYRVQADVLQQSLLLHATGGQGRLSALYEPLKQGIERLRNAERHYRYNLQSEAVAVLLLTAQYNTLGQDGQALLSYVQDLNTLQSEQRAGFRQRVSMLIDSELNQGWARTAFGKTPPAQFMLGLAASFFPTTENLTQLMTRATTDPGRLLQDTWYTLQQLAERVIENPQEVLSAIYQASEQQSSSSEYARGLMTGLLVDAALTLGAAGVGSTKLVNWARNTRAANSLANMGEELLKIAHTADKLTPDELVQVQKTIAKIRQIERNYPVGDWITSNSRLQRLRADAVRLADSISNVSVGQRNVTPSPLALRAASNATVPQSVNLKPGLIPVTSGGLPLNLGNIRPLTGISPDGISPAAISLAQARQFITQRLQADFPADLVAGQALSLVNEFVLPTITGVYQSGQSVSQADLIAAINRLYQDPNFPLQIQQRLHQAVLEQIATEHSLSPTLLEYLSVEIGLAVERNVSPDSGWSELSTFYQNVIDNQPVALSGGGAMGQLDFYIEAALNKAIAHSAAQTLPAVQQSIPAVQQTHIEQALRALVAEQGPEVLDAVANDTDAALALYAKISEIYNNSPEGARARAAIVGPVAMANLGPNTWKHVLNTNGSTRLTPEQITQLEQVFARFAITDPQVRQSMALGIVNRKLTIEEVIRRMVIAQSYTSSSSSLDLSGQLALGLLLKLPSSRTPYTLPVNWDFPHIPVSVRDIQQYVLPRVSDIDLSDVTSLNLSAQIVDEIYREQQRSGLVIVAGPPGTGTAEVLAQVQQATSATVVQLNRNGTLRHYQFDILRALVEAWNSRRPDTTGPIVLQSRSGALADMPDWEGLSEAIRLFEKEYRVPVVIVADVPLLQPWLRIASTSDGLDFYRQQRDRLDDLAGRRNLNVQTYFVPRDDQLVIEQLWTLLGSEQGRNFALSLGIDLNGDLYSKLLFAKQHNDRDGFDQILNAALAQNRR